MISCGGSGQEFPDDKRQAGGRIGYHPWAPDDNRIFGFIIRPLISRPADGDMHLFPAVSPTPSVAVRIAEGASRGGTGGTGHVQCILCAVCLVRVRFRISEVAVRTMSVVGWLIMVRPMTYCSDRNINKEKYKKHRAKGSSAVFAVSSSQGATSQWP